ncbi:MAG: hypothetical protein QG662_9 [Pseudomonadota bacterium]|nr:hypothetical protein [Pseudomonadota bacterium]
MDEKPGTGLLGATSLVGECVIPLLIEDGRRVFAYSRTASGRATEAGLTWLRPGEPFPPHAEAAAIGDWLCVAPIWTLPEYFSMLERHGARRVVALSSTSRFSKINSSDAAENATASRLAESEASLQEWAESKGIEWVILRPTLIYGRGRDKNIAEIARFVKRFGFFPLLGKAEGRRQPIHAEDVAAACASALRVARAANRAYDISGGETLSYREMVMRVFSSLRRPSRTVTIPLAIFRMAAAYLRLFPRYRNWSAAMAERMNVDLAFDHADAARELGFSPRPFRLAPDDLPE